MTQAMGCIGVVGLRLELAAAGVCSSGPTPGEDPGTIATSASKSTATEDFAVGSVDDKVGIRHATGSILNAQVQIRVRTKTCSKGRDGQAGDFLSDDPTCPVGGAGAVGNRGTCDLPSSCPSRCDDGKACTTAVLTGSAATSNAACGHLPGSACDLLCVPARHRRAGRSNGSQTARPGSQWPECLSGRDQWSYATGHGGPGNAALRS
jgi:hypothetical protein